MSTNNYSPVFAELLQRDKSSQQGDGSVSFGCLMSVRQYARLYDITLKYVSAGANCLDWGGGDGHFAYFLSQHGYKASLYAFGRPTFIVQEINEGKINFTQGDKNAPVALPYDSSSMDAVFSVGVLEHVTEFNGSESASLQEIARILKSGGQFVCYHFPNRGSWIEALSRGLGGHYHANTYTKAQIVKLFQPCFDIKLIYRYAILPRNSLRRLPKFLGNNAVFASLFDTVDRIASRLLPWFCQNWVVVAENRSAAN
jgi:ubiquinone/menaquinone biosynthesis C-methylase UbiE